MTTIKLYDTMSNLVATATWNNKKSQYYVVFGDNHRDNLYVKDLARFIRDEGLLTGRDVVESDWFTRRE